MKLKCILWALLAISAAQLGCQSQPSARTFLIEPEDARRLGYRVATTLDLALPDHQRVKYAEAFDDRLVVVEAPGNQVTSVSLTDGAVQWRRTVGARSQRLHAPVRYGEKILINAESELFLLSAENGELLERQTLTEPVDHTPAVHGSLAIFGSVTGMVFAHDLASGHYRWRRRLAGEVLTAPVVNNRDVFVTDATGRCELLSADTGEFLWSARTFGPITAPPWMDQGTIYLASSDQSLYALRRSSGRDHWIYRSGKPLDDGPVVLGSLVLLPVPDKGLQALSARRGQEKWTLAAPAVPITQRQNRILLNRSEELLVVDADRGRMIKQATTRPLLRIVSLDQDRLLLVSPHGKLQRLDPIPLSR
ncbi:MAG: hypothetical protein CMJ18_16805 [Phycisphaeraceae bacterium]|nr:hypothetical protein [Phycisphaeraceae bacterium]